MEPDRRVELLGIANRAQAVGKLSEATTALDTLLAADPRDAEARLLAGIVAAKQGRAADCEAILTPLHEEYPDTYEVELWLGMALRTQGRGSEAVPFARRAVELRGTDPVARSLLGRCLMEIGDFASAEAELSAALAANPRAAGLHEALGHSRMALGKPREGIASLRTAAQLDPNPRVLSALAEALLGEQLTGDAIAVARQMLDADADSVAAHLFMARALADEGRAEDGLTYAERALGLAPDSSEAALVVAQLLQGVGQFSRADALLRRALELHPDSGSIYGAIVRSHRIQEDERDLVRAMRLAAASDASSEAQRTQLFFALGKAYDDLGDYEEANAAFDEANRLARGRRVFDRRRYQTGNDLVIRGIGKSLLARHQGAGLESDVPLFVVGMIRSGTTLTNQVLSSHPLVGSIGEQRFWLQNCARAFNLAEGRLEVAALRDLASQYLDRLAALAPGKMRVVDKMPMNYEVLGLIHLAFPRARVIHVARHPVDTCLSIYSTPNSARIEWANDRADIVFAYREYQRLIAHWRAVLPAGCLLEITYEDLVSHREAVTRRLLEFCDVPWNDACLRPEANTQAVMTPSVWQVRQPVHTHSLHRWQRYEPWLGAFADLVT